MIFSFLSLSASALPVRGEEPARIAALMPPAEAAVTARIRAELSAAGFELQIAEPRGWPPSREEIAQIARREGAVAGLALISSENVCEPADAIAAQYEATERDLVLSYLPMCHVAEKIYSVFLPLATGLVVHFGESIDTVQEDLREVSPTPGRGRSTPRSPSARRSNARPVWFRRWRSSAARVSRVT